MTRTLSVNESEAQGPPRLERLREIPPTTITRALCRGVPGHGRRAARSRR